MKVAGLEILRCDAGWRNYHFLKLTTDEGIVGWSEFDEGFGSPGVGTVIERLAPRVVGRAGLRSRANLRRTLLPDPAGRRRSRRRGAGRDRERFARRQSQGARGAVPCAPRRQDCATECGSTGRIARPGASTTRISYKPAITSLDGVRAIGAEARDRGFGALKTNVFIYEGGAPRGWRPGFGVPFAPELNVDKTSTAQPARPSRSDPRRRRAGYGPAPRSQFQRQDRGLC